ncbi:MAG: DUF4838 domain-containing protein [Ginsengibacter sp.]
MKKLTLFSITIFFLFAVQAQQFTLVNMGKSNCRIIIPERANAVEIQAAKIFQDYIQRISGAIIPIGADNIKPENNEILIGNVNRPELNNVPLEKLKKDGLFIKNTGKRLIISGGTGKGALYGVYTFLEQYLGCRKYSPAVAPYVPQKKTIILNSIDEMEVPAFTYRVDFYADVLKDQEYMDWHKLDNCFGKPDTGNEWGSFVHTFDQLLGSKEYGESHPEYFSFYDGERHPGYSESGRVISQLCLTNPNVLDIVCKSLQTNIKENPGAQYWSVSQNDNVNYCKGPLCSALDEKYASFAPGSKMYGTHNHGYSPIGQGSLLTFVNKVAEKFPDKIISTLAYQYTRVPPKGIVPRENVNIMLCNIESPRNVPFATGDTSFSNDLIGWTRLTHNIILWDYVVQFSNLMSPFPNLHTLQPNLQYLHDNGVQMIFSEGNPETGGEFSELRAYLIAKLLWNPDVDINKVMNDFLSGYYGNASGMIRQYIDLLHNEMEKSGVKLSIYGNPVEERKTFLSDSLVTVYNQLFDRAEKAVSGSPELLQRVKTARLPVHYAMLEIARDQKTGKQGAFIVAKDNTLKPNPKIVKILYAFVYGCQRANVSRVREGRITPDQYLDGYTKFLSERK